ncbi:MAG TPA: invasin domain 3-containing protein [Thermoanaerobaculia bacterium]
MRLSRARALLALTALFAAFACSKATPVAPTGAVLSISANPSQIGLTGSSTITIFGSKPTGSPLDPGTQIRLSTTIGTIQGIATVQNGGTATATLRGDGRTGAAMVTATTGAAMGATAMTTVQIGIAMGDKPVLLVSASPSNVPVLGTAQITVIARNGDGSPVAAGQEVILTTSLGTLHPSRPKTGADGTATSTLDAGTTGGTATISAILGASDAATTMVTIRDAAVAIGLVANPSSITYSNATGMTTLTAFVTNAEGLPVSGAVVSFSADRPVTFSASQISTDTNGQAMVTMTAQQSQVPSGSIMVTAQTSSGNGQPLKITISVGVGSG